MTSINPISSRRYTYYPQSDSNQCPILLLDESEQGIIKRVDFQPGNDILSSNQDLSLCSFRFELPYFLVQKSNDARRPDKTILSPRRIEDFDDCDLELLAEKLTVKYKKPGRRNPDFDVKTDLLEIRYYSQNLRNKLGDSYRGL